VVNFTTWLLNPPRKGCPVTNNKGLGGFQGQYRHWTNIALAMLDIKPQFLTCTQPTAHQQMTMLSQLPHINLKGPCVLYIRKNLKFHQAHASFMYDSQMPQYIGE